MPSDRDFRNTGLTERVMWALDELMELQAEELKRKATSAIAPPTAAMKLEALDVFGCVLLIMQHCNVIGSDVTAWLQKQQSRGHAPIFSGHAQATVRRLVAAVPPSYLSTRVDSGNYIRDPAGVLTRRPSACRVMRRHRGGRMRAFDMSHKHETSWTEVAALYGLNKDVIERDYTAHVLGLCCDCRESFNAHGRMRCSFCLLVQRTWMALKAGRLAVPARNAHLKKKALARAMALDMLHEEANAINSRVGP